MSRKEFVIEDDNGKEIKLAVRNPQYDDIDEADKVYSGKIASMVRESGTKKLLLRQEINNFLKEHGIWSKTDEDKITALQKDIDILLSQLRKGGLKVSEGRAIAIQVVEKRKEISRIMSKRQIFDDTTIETAAENERYDFLIYVCTVHSEDGKNYWPSFEEMKSDKYSITYRKANICLWELVYGINPEFEKNLPENKWLRKYNFVDDELNYTDRKTGKKIDVYGNDVEELERQAKKQVDNLQGDIVEEAPFIDDETSLPVTSV